MKQNKYFNEINYRINLSAVAQRTSLLPISQFGSRCVLYIHFINSLSLFIKKMYLQVNSSQTKWTHRDKLMHTVSTLNWFIKTNFVGGKFWNPVEFCQKTTFNQITDRQIIVTQFQPIKNILRMVPHISWIPLSSCGCDVLWLACDWDTSKQQQQQEDHWHCPMAIVRLTMTSNTT